MFRDTVAGGGKVRALNAKGAAEKFSRKGLDELTEHPFLDFMAGGNSVMTGLDVRRATFALRYVEGEAFWIKERAHNRDAVRDFSHD